MEDIIVQLKDSYEKTINSFVSTLTTIRAGRANPTILDRVMVDYYGEKTPLNQIALITSPEPTQLLIKPYDSGDIKAIMTALNESDLSINPISDASVIRVPFPPLTEDRRKEYVKQVKKFVEEAKVAIRNIRREYNSLLDKDLYSEDMIKRLEVDVQKQTDEAVKKLDELTKKKETEIMTI